MPTVLSTVLVATSLATSLKVYHLNPITAGVVPKNMDTGDIGGDLYFYLGQFLLPVECQNISHTSGGPQTFDCSNLERRDPSLVVTEVDLEVKEDAWTSYAACNLCNGTDPLTGKQCEKGTYICDDRSHYDHTKVGVMNITERFVINRPPECKAGREKLCPITARTDKDSCESCFYENRYALEYKYNCSRYEHYWYCPGEYYYCSPSAPDWSCWRDNIPRKTAGMWYSTLEEGQCTGKNEGNCSWTVKATKTVNETCMHESLVDAVRDYSPDCFQSCAQPKNESSPCFIGCFFDAILGPESRNSSDHPISGMPFSTLQAGWTRAFNGHCPLIHTA